jgi:hypothetical protein
MSGRALALTMGGGKPRVTRKQRRELEEGLRRARAILSNIPDGQIVQGVRDDRETR